MCGDSCLPEQNYTSYSLLPESEVFRFKNIYAVQEIIPQVFRLVFKWGCKGEKSTYHTFIEYFDSLSIGQGKRRKFFHGNDLIKLSQCTSTEELDASLLFKLIQISCSGLKPCKDEVWIENDESKLECLLWNLKEQRNSVCHDVASVATSSTIFHQIRSTTRQTLVVAGSKYSIDQVIIDAEVNNLEGSISNMAKTKEEKRRIEVQYNFWKEGFSESKLYWESYCTLDECIFSGKKFNRSEVFYPVKIATTILGDPAELSIKKETMPYNMILDNWLTEDKSSVTILIGEAGSGKSTLVKVIAEQFFNLASRKIRSLQRFHLLYVLECKSRIYNSLESFVQSTFPRTCQWLGLQDVTDSFPFLGNLVIIDGYDEINECSALVLKEIIHYIKIIPNSQLVFTTRPHATNNLKYFLKKEGLHYRSCEMMPIIEEEEQLNFLNRYRRIDPTTSAEGLLAAFANQNSDIKRIFFAFPTNLVLFYFLFSKSKGELDNVTDTNVVTDRMIFLYKTCILNKFASDGIKNLEAMVDSILEMISEYAFASLGMDRTSFLDNDILDISNKCRKIIRNYGALHVIDTKQILFTIFRTVRQPLPKSTIRYQFHHKSVQEMFACKALFKRILANKYSTSVWAIMENILEGGMARSTSKDVVVKK